MQTLKSGPKNWMNLQSAGSGNPLKSDFESKIRAKIFTKSANLFAYSPPLPKVKPLTDLSTYPFWQKMYTS